MLYRNNKIPIQVAIYSINDVEKITGIKAHTIRIWEKRYNILPPKRTKTNIRFYDEQDLRKISNIVLLNHHGYKISEISDMQDTQIGDLVAGQIAVESFGVESLDAITLAVLQLDEQKFLYLVDTNIRQDGFDKTFDNLLLPLLDKLHILWLSGSIKRVHEEFVNTIIKRKLIDAISKIQYSNPHDTIKVICFLNPKENQELSCLHTEYFLKKKNCSVLNLGINLHLSDLLDSVQIVKPRFIFTFVHEQDSVDYLKQFLIAFEQLEFKPILLLSGYYAHDFIQYKEQVKIISNFNELKIFLNNLSSKIFK